MLELEHEFRIVDVHLELEPDGSRGTYAAGDPERLERELHQSGVVRGLVFPAQRDGGYLKANNATARMSVGRPFVAVARITGSRAPGSSASARLLNMTTSRGSDHTTPDDIEQFAYDDRFAGFRLSPPVDGLPDREVLDAMASAGLPVFTYGGEGFRPETIAEHLLGVGFPVVVSHFGGYPADADMMNRTIDLLNRYDECYLDTSFVRLRDPLERAVREHPDRVLFGSGAPAFHPNVGVMEILTLDVPQDAMRKVFSKNPARVVEELAP
jgi:hypothetical protein